MSHSTPSTLIVNWEAGELLPAPRKSQPNRREMRFPCVCPGCGSTRMLRKSDALKGSICRRCHTSKIGRKGYETTVSRYGRDFAVECIRAYRLENPSEPERTVESMLIKFGANYAREYVWAGETQTYILDFVLLEGDRPVAAIEVDGWCHFNRPERIDRDRRLESEFPLPLLRIDATAPIKAEAINMLRWSIL